MPERAKRITRRILSLTPAPTPQTRPQDTYDRRLDRFSSIGDSAEDLCRAN